MIAKLAYLTTPAPGVFLLNFQSVDTLGNDVLLGVEDGLTASCRMKSFSAVTISTTPPVIAFHILLSAKGG